MVCSPRRGTKILKAESEVLSWLTGLQILHPNAPTPGNLRTKKATLQTTTDLGSPRDLGRCCASVPSCSFRDDAAEDQGGGEAADDDDDDD